MKKGRTDFEHLHLAVTPALADEFDAICREWKLKRPHALARMVKRELRLMQRRHQTQTQEASHDLEAVHE